MDQVRFWHIGRDGVRRYSDWADARPWKAMYLRMVEKYPAGYAGVEERRA